MLWSGLLVAAVPGIAAAAEIAFSVSFDDPAGEFTEYYADIERLTLAAAQDWAQYLVVPEGVSPSIEIMVDFREEVGEASATSNHVLIIREENGVAIFRQGVVHEILTGEDINDAEPDALISLKPVWLKLLFWFDPDPKTRVAPIPRTYDTDFYSLMLHELAHVLGFNGNLAEDGSPYGDFISEYDELVSVADGGRMFFNGTTAKELYGGPVPLTPGDYKHIGVPREGSLENDLMHQPANCSIGGRCHISRLDLAILHDTGLPIRELADQPTLEIKRQPDGGVRLCWQDAFGPVRVQSSDTLEPGSWTDLSGLMDGTRWDLAAPLSPSLRFFRVGE